MILLYFLYKYKKQYFNLKTLKTFYRYINKYYDMYCMFEELGTKKD